MSKDVMRLLSWNIQWGRGIDGRVDLGRIAREIGACDPDVICLQEVAVNHPGLPGGAAGSQPEILARQFPGYEAIYAAGSDLPDGRGGRRQFGELILSRLPLLQVFRHQLPWPADPGVPSMQRVAVEAVVDAPVGPLRVLTTHLEFYSQSQRRVQIEALRSIHAEGWRHAQRPRSAAETDPPFAVLPRGEFTVLCGDFNCPAGAAEYFRLQQPCDGEFAAAPSLVDAWSLAYPGVPNAPTVGLSPAPWLAAPACYDFFFVSGNLAGRVREVVVDAESIASDHQSIRLDISI